METDPERGWLWEKGQRRPKGCVWSVFTGLGWARWGGSLQVQSD